MWRHLPPVLGGRQPLSNEPSAVQPTDPTSAPAPAPVPLVPDLVGLPSTDARRLARAARLAATVEERVSSEGLWGRVLEQDPVPGATGAPEGVVTLFVGARPRVPVPDIRGRDEDEALSMLREVGLGADRRAARRSDRVPEGCVVRTRPRAGTEVAIGSHVSYVVAAGPTETTVRGHKRDRTTARATRLADGSFLLTSKGRGEPRR